VKTRRRTAIRRSHSKNALLIFCCVALTLVLVNGDWHSTANAADAPQPSLSESSTSATGTAPPVEPADWATYNYDITGSRHNTAESVLGVENVASLEEKWRFPAAGSDETIGVIHATPSVVAGCVYFGTATYAAFYKLTPDGRVAWKYEIGDAGRRLWREFEQSRGLNPQDGVYTSALVTDEYVYFADVLGIMYCLDRETGERVWYVNSKVAPFPGAHHANLVMASPILADDKIVFGGGAYEHALPLDKTYKCCHGRGFVVALDPRTGDVRWKYDVGPEPEKFDPPIVLEDEFGRHVFHYGPSTSSVWSTPSWDEATNTVYFGTDVHNSPRKPTKDDPRNYTKHSAAVIAVSATDGGERWVTQLSAGDVWNHSMSTYEKAIGVYKDQSIGDTPKLYSIDLEGRPTPVVGVGCKNGGFYVLRRDNGEIVANTPIYTGPPVKDPQVDPRMLALPSAIGGLQTGCASDGTRVFTNGIDKLPNPDYQFGRKPNPPTGGRVTAISLDTRTEHWRHERPKIDAIGGTTENPLYRDCGDPVACGIAVANGLLFCTTLGSNQLLCLDASTGNLLKEIPLGPVFCGPSVSRGRVYVGTGNTQFMKGDREAFFPKKYTGELISFGLPGEDEVSRMSGGK